MFNYYCSSRHLARVGMEPYQWKLAGRRNFTKDADGIESSPLQQIEVVDSRHHPSIYKLDDAEWPILGSIFKGGKNAIPHVEGPAKEVEDGEFVLVVGDGGGDNDYVLISEDMTATTVVLFFYLHVSFYLLCHHLTLVS